MIRSSIKPKALKPRKCKQCGDVFQRRTSTQTVCGPKCAEAWSTKVREKKAERANKDERISLRERKTKLKTRGDWIREAQAAVNKVVRLRDILAGHGCISCEIKLEQRFGGAFDAGHFRSVGSAPHLRFYLPNVRLQCKRCNRDRGGMHSDFRVALIERIGIKRVEEIESMQWTAKWDIPYLQRLKKVMNKKARRLERRIEQRREAA